MKRLKEYFGERPSEVEIETARNRKAPKKGNKADSLVAKLGGLMTLGMGKGGIKTMPPIMREAAKRIPKPVKEATKGIRKDAKEAVKRIPEPIREAAKRISKPIREATKRMGS